MADHAKFPPSSMHRLLSCPASWQMEQAAPPGKPSEYALKGTLLHEVARYIREDRKHPEFKFLSIDNRSAVEDAVVYSLQNTFGKPYYEQRVNLKCWGLPEIWGTADIVDVSNGLLQSMDDKYGSGVQVYAYQNAQCLCYLAGAVCKFGKRPMYTIHIIQPFLDHYDTWSLSHDELVEWIVGTLKPGIELARSDSPPFNPSEDNCRFCDAHMSCRVRYEKLAKDMDDIMDQFQLGETQHYDDVPFVRLEELVDFFNRAEEIIAYRAEIGKYLTARILDGEDVPTKRVVAGRAYRKWKNEEEVMQFAKERGLNFNIVKVLSPAQAEKKYKLKKDQEFQELIIKPKGKPKLVDADDKRPDYLDQNYFFEEV